MANMKPIDAKSQFDDVDLMFRPNHMVFFHDTIDNPVPATLMGTAVGDVLIPDTAFGAGMITKENGIVISDEPETATIEAAGYTQAVLTYASGRTVKLTAEYMESLKVALLEAVYGQNFDKTVATNGSVETLIADNPNWRGVRGYVLRWMETPQGDWCKLDVLPNLQPASMPTTTIKGDGSSEVTSIEWEAKYDADMKSHRKTIEFGPGFVARAERLGYTVDVTP